MKVSTSERLKEIMKKYNIRQVDILKRAEPYCLQYNIKLGRNDLSQYVSGKVVPGQEKLTILAKALNVNEVWLMGYDVSMERNDYEDRNILRFDAELEDVFNIITSDGYSYYYSQTPNYNIIIKNDSGEIITCIQDYELINRYESIQKKGGFLNTNTLLGLNNELKFPSDNVLHDLNNKDNRLTNIIYYYQHLNETGKKKAHDYVFDLFEQPKYSQTKITKLKIDDEITCTLSPETHFTNVKEATAFLKSHNLAAWQNKPLTNKDIIYMANLLYEKEGD